MPASGSNIREGPRRNAEGSPPKAGDSTPRSSVTLPGLAKAGRRPSSELRQSVGSEASASSSPGEVSACHALHPQARMGPAQACLEVAFMRARALQAPMPMPPHLPAASSADSGQTRADQAHRGQPGARQEPATAPGQQARRGAAGSSRSQVRSTMGSCSGQEPRFCVYSMLWYVCLCTCLSGMLGS